MPTYRCLTPVCALPVLDRDGVRRGTKCVVRVRLVLSLEYGAAVLQERSVRISRRQYRRLCRS